MSEIGQVHIIDDEDAIRDSLVFLLTSAAIDAVEHSSAESFLEALPELAIGCIVTDVRMPGMSGIDLLQRLRAADKHLPVIVMTGHGDIPMAVEALKTGAFDFIEKPFSDDQIISVVRSALEYRTRAKRQDSDRAGILARVESLTQREKDVFEGLVAGHPNKTIAYDLGISPRTVEIYRANVMVKLNAASLSDVVRMAFIVEKADDGD
ncbi:response regulator FixJ [Chelatococcus asaccharovorans]|uniref:response regulator FixJ n=1 Tax=Chelatococcus asaccharovorans TaxID=28210 RepID=UPI00224C6F4C|nr:response regulator FixJ [Chelatococcus asaccharovorans]CAH1659804.1 Transcriptional regulatory protein FixJ [Chelatococcus asaccharovorans]CAH1684055.1 Transcriptional regulatory protein FixJ [Chelatococcus asaccharovorans]